MSRRTDTIHRASEPYSLVSRYELGPDSHESKVHFDAEAGRVRTMKGTSQFKVRLDRENLGVMLRRKFDYLYPNQCAKVWVRSDVNGQWQYVGEWFTAGSNTCVYSYPRQAGELGATEHRVITSNRRWREEEFLIPRRMTEGLEQLEIRLEHIPDDKELFPGHPFEVESVWSESRYWVYCYKMPKVTLWRQ